MVIDQVNPLCGDEVAFFFKFSPVKSFPPRVVARGKLQRESRNWIPNQVRDDRMDSRKIVAVSFVGKGCAISVASASILTEKIKGQTIGALSKITGEDVFELLGGPVAPARIKCAFLPLEAIKRIELRG